MFDLKELNRSVTGTLRRASVRTGQPLQPRAQHDVLVMGRGDPEESVRVTDAINRQREICATVQEELARLREDRRELGSAAHRERERREIMESELQLVSAAISLERRRRSVVERQIDRCRRELTFAAESLRSVTTTTRRARDVIERISGNLARR